MERNIRILWYIGIALSLGTLSLTSPAVYVAGAAFLFLMAYCIILGVSAAIVVSLTLDWLLPA